MVHYSTAELLGRHVTRSSENAPGLAMRCGVCRGRFLAAECFRHCELGQTEGEDLDPAVASQEQVLGLEVPMRNTLIMSGRQAGSDLARVLEGFTPG